MQAIKPTLPSLPDVLVVTFAASQVVTFAANQPPYKPLPGVLERDGRLTTRWKLTWRERFKILRTGDLWLQVLTFNRPVQPVKLLVDEPSIGDK